MKKQLQNINFYHDRLCKTVVIANALPTFIIQLYKIDDSRSH